MRILHALSQTELTGSEAYAFDLASHQVGSGHEIFTVSDQFHLSFPGERLKLRLSTSSFILRMRQILALRKYLIQNRIEVIHCHSRGACRHLYWASLGLKIPILTTLHGYQHVSASKRLFNIYGDYVLCVCEKIKEQLVRDFRLPDYQVETLRNPLPQIPQADESSHRRKNLVLVGRNSGPKGERLKRIFLEIVPQWLRADPERRVHLVLSGLSSHDMQILRNDLRLQDLGTRISIDGYLANLILVLKGASVVLASGRIALEALLLKKPVLALGEASYLGEVRAENTAEVLASNFGDVGPREELPMAQIAMDLESLSKTHFQPAPDPVREIFMAEFRRERILERIVDLYRGLRLAKRCGSLPILMYHKIVRENLQSQHRIFVTDKNFRRHLRTLKKYGRTFLNFKDLADFWFERRSLSEFPKRPVILSFDDGYRNNLELALPALHDSGAKASLFLLADHDILKNIWDEDEGDGSAEILSLEEKRQLPTDRFEVGSHGFSHRALPELSREEVLREMRESKFALERDLGQNIHAFAYPFGRIDERLPELAAEAGYDFAVNTDLGAALWFTNRHSLFRVNIFPEDGPLQILRKSSGWYRLRYFKKRGR